MKKITFALICAFICTVGSLKMNAKDSNNKQMLVLDNYTIPINKKGAVVGKFVSPDKGSVVIVNDASGMFEMGRDNELLLKKNKEVTPNSPLVYTITVKSNDGEKTFDLVKDEFVKNKVIAHRGAWKHHNVTQNTLGSISEAMKLGCEASEIDVWLTKDKKVAVCHDMDLDGKIIEKTDLKDLKTVQLKNNESLPTLEEVLQLMKTQNKHRLVIELKSNKWNDNVIALADSVLDIVNRNNAQAWVDYISFDYRGLKKLREKDVTAHLSFLEPSVDLDLQKLDGMSGVDYHFSVFEEKDRLVERCSVLGLTTNVWTVNDEELMKKLLKDNVDYITTDEPELLLNVIQVKK